MLSLSPLAIASLVIVVVSVVGIVITTLTKSRRFAGYESIAHAVPRIAAKLKNSEIFRDGGDLVISGNHGAIPLLIRFSNSESTPGLNISGGAPIGFAATFSPKERSGGGGQLLRTGNAKLDARFVARTTAPQETSMFVSSPVTQQHLEKLCCSSNTMLQLSKGKIELIELLIPSDTDEHVLAHLDSLAVLSQQAAKMPGAHALKIERLEGQGSSWLLKAAIAIGVMTVGFLLVSFKHPSDPVLTTQSGVPSGISPVDAQAIPNILAWKTADSTQLRPDLLGWLRGYGVEPATKIDLDPSNSGTSSSTAYLLVTDKAAHSQRVVWVHNQQILCDLAGSIDGIAGIPRDAVARIRSDGDASAPQPDGDGLLLVRNYDDPASATVFFLKQGKMNSISPADFHTLQLR